MKTNKIILKNGRRPLVSLLALFLLSATFFPAIEALASPTGFDVLSAEFVKGDGEYNLNITLERTRQTAVSIVGTLRFTEDYTEENLTLVDPEQSWGTMVKDEIKSIIYNLSTIGDLTYPEGFLLDIVYIVNGQPKAETLTLTTTWGSGEFQPEILSVPFILDFDAYGTNKGSGTVLKTWVRYDPGRFGSPHYHWQNIKFAFDTSDYEDFDFETQTWNFNTQINKGQTVMKQYTLGPYLENAAGNEHYAFNKGYFDAAVQVGGTDPSFWQDNEDDGFYVLNTTGHAALIFYLVDDWWFDDPEFGRDEPSVFIDDVSENHFDPTFDIQLLPIHSDSWNPPSGKTVSEYLALALPAAKLALGLNQDWTKSTTTSDKNHGFDILIAFTGRVSTNIHVGVTSKNAIAICGGYTVYPFIYWMLTDQYVDNLVQHEVSHCYEAVDNTGLTNIMGKPLGWPFYQNWLPADFTIIYNNRDNFDGV